MAFTKDYLMLKSLGYTDVEIAKEMSVHRDTITNWKKTYKIPDIRKPRKNYQGVTEEQLLKGESIGLSRRFMLRRVREYGWTPEQAVSTPKIIGRRKEECYHKQVR
jgi:hypothetical protein